MDISVEQLAHERGVSARRVRQLASEGRVRAHKVGGQWRVDPSELMKPANLGRPLSQRMAWALIAALSGDAHLALDPAEKSRIRQRVARLRLASDPAPQLSSWLVARAHVERRQAAAGSLGDLRSDGRLLLSGISDPRAGISAADQAEAYIHPDDLRALERDHLLVSSDAPNVILHVVDVREHCALNEGDSIPLGLVMADLADHHSPRESAQLRRLLGAL